MIPSVETAGVPFLTTEQMVEVDRVMIEEYGIDLIRMMENAGRGLASLARWLFLDGDTANSAIVVMAGTGGNGGGALVAARWLHGAGADVTVLVTRTDESFGPIPRQQLDIVRRMGIVVGSASDVGSLGDPDVVIDGLIGYSLRGEPRGDAAALIAWANASRAPVLSLDAPSGVDTTTGAVFDPAIMAAATMTLALPKQGLRAPGVARNVGDLYLADISVPPDLYQRSFGMTVGPLFAQSDVVRLV